MFQMIITGVAGTNYVPLTIGQSFLSYDTLQNVRKKELE